MNVVLIVLLILATPLCFSQRVISADEAAESILYEVAEEIAAKAIAAGTNAAEAMKGTKATPNEMVKAMMNAMAKSMVKDLKGEIIEIVDAIIESNDNFHDINTLANISMEAFAVQRQIRAA